VEIEAFAPCNSLTVMAPKSPNFCGAKYGCGETGDDGDVSPKKGM